MNNKETGKGKEHINADNTVDNQAVDGSENHTEVIVDEQENILADQHANGENWSDLSSEATNDDNSAGDEPGFADENSGSSQNHLNDTERLKKDLNESNDRYLRLAAEFDNFRKRTSRERSEMFKTANKDVLVAVIPILDDLERAEKFMLQASDVQAVREGVSLISSKLKNILSQQGLKEITSVGEPFDTDRHEAITNIPAPSENLKGKVVDETEKGYMLGDKVIRFAKVVVGQ